MKTIIFTMGTRGDVQPYIYLAKALIQAGHEASIGTHPFHEKLVTEAGVPFTPVGRDVNMEYEAAVIRGKNSNPAMAMLKTMNFVFRIIEESTGDIYESCKGKDLIIVSHSLMGATEAEALHIPTVNVVLQTEMLPLVKKEKTFRDKLFAVFINPQIVKPYNRIRKKYGLTKLKSMDQVMSDAVTLLPISEHVVERNPYWDDKVSMTGYWTDEAEEQYLPDAVLEEFLRSGEKPIILALGAMSFEDNAEKEKLEQFIRAFERTGMRAVIQGFSKALKEVTLPETMIHAGSIPHKWLFRQGYAVIHHCGFGTATAAMMYGIPSIPVPHVLDQFGVALQLQKLGISTAPVKSSELSEERIIGAIEELKDHYDSLKEQAETLAEKLCAEQGLKRAVELIQESIV